MLILVSEFILAMKIELLMFLFFESMKKLV